MYNCIHIITAHSKHVMHGDKISFLEQVVLSHNPVVRWVKYKKTNSNPSRIITFIILYLFVESSDLLNKSLLKLVSQHLCS